MSERRLLFAFLALLWLAMIIWPARGFCLVYTIKSGVALRSGPGLGHKLLKRLDHNETLHPVEKKGNWLKVRALDGRKGFIRRDMISDTWIKVHKKERRLMVIRNDRVLKTYRAALSPQNPLGDKVREGDGATPEGRFFICERIKRPGAARYGARSLRLSYPGIEDARRGLANGLIDFKTYLGIVRAVHDGRMPDQRTPLGSSIRIHGGGNQHDWTLGCVALSDEDVREVYDLTGPGTRVEVYRSAQQDRELNRPDYLARHVVAGGLRQLVEPALYTEEATGAPRLKYPGGDVKPEMAVCTDIVIRALRAAGLDLQSLVHEDALVHPARYKHSIRKPNYHIDHRRVRNLQVYFSHHALVLPADDEYGPGHIVTMDTGMPNGIPFDHIGLLDNGKDRQGLPLVINIWAMGLRTESMNLLGESYPAIVGHFSLTHPFDY